MGPTSPSLRAALAPLGPLTFVAATDGNHGRAVAHMARLLGYARPDLRARGNRRGAHRRDRERGRAGHGDRRHLRRRGARVGGRARRRRRAGRVGHVVGRLHRGPAHRHRGLRDDLRRGRRPARWVRRPRSSWCRWAWARWPPRWSRHYAAAATIVVVEPQSAACGLRVGARRASRCSCPGPHDSIMAGLNCGMVSILAWPMVSAGADVFVAIDDAAAEDRRCGRSRRSGSSRARRGAAALGGLRAVVADGTSTSPGERVLVLCTEGATDPVAYRRITGREP